MIYEVTKTFEHEGRVYQPGELINLKGEKSTLNLGDKIKKLKKRTKVITNFKTK